jgi:predicted porin
MKKTLTLVAAAAATLVLALPAHAQSSVTLFGVLDLTVRQVKNNTSQKRLDDSGLTSSRLGIRGTEDLGGGLRAGFWIEGALVPDAGNPSGQTWQRRSTISLTGGFGELTVGRIKNPTGLNWEQLDVFGDTGMTASSRLQAPVLPAGGAYQSFSRSSNSITYITPGRTGLFGHVTVAAGEGNLGNKYTGARLGYRSGALLALAAYGVTQVSPSVDAKMLNFGATYDLKSFKLWGMYSTTDVGPNDQRNILLGVSVPADKWLLRASYHDYQGKGGISNRSANQLSLGAAYSLSRRTAVYSNFARISNTNTAFTVATGSPLSAGRNSSGYELGLRHSF